MNKWNGFKDFIVSKKVKENNNITSFYLEPKDKSELPDYLAGQFISVRAKDGENYCKPKQYTLSSISNNKYFRISIKREAEGHVSKLFCDKVNEGDTIQATMPVGRFVLEDSDKPLVLIGGGIGITPMLTMAYKAVQEKRPTHLIYSVPNTEFYAFHEELKKLKEENDCLRLTLIFTRPTEEDKLDKKYDIEGRMTKEWLKDNIDINSDTYFCGPIEFMKALYHNLIDIGVDKDNINYELFAPGVDITKTA